jgi:hypothetical protein
MRMVAFSSFLYIYQLLRGIPTQREGSRKSFTPSGFGKLGATFASQHCPSEIHHRTFVLMDAVKVFLKIRSLGTGCKPAAALSSAQYHLS